MSKWGEGTGVPMEHCADPNRPSYDPATCQDKTTKMLVWLIEMAWDKMNAWEKKFCGEIYGQSPISRRQHIRVYKIHRKYAKAPAELEKP